MESSREDHLDNGIKEIAVKIKDMGKTLPISVCKELLILS